MAKNFLLDLKRILSSNDEETLIFAPLPFDTSRYGNALTTCDIDESALLAVMNDGALTGDTMNAFSAILIARMGKTLLRYVDLISSVYSTSMEELCREIDRLEYLSAPLLFTNLTTHAQHIGRVSLNFTEFAETAMAHRESGSNSPIFVNCVMQVESKPIAVDDDGRIYVPESTVRENYKFATKMKDFGGFHVTFLDPGGVHLTHLEDSLFKSEKTLPRSYEIDYLRPFELHSLPLMVSEMTFKPMEEIFDEDPSPDYPPHVLHSPAPALQ